jgi:hypothetical protein
MYMRSATDRKHYRIYDVSKRFFTNFEVIKSQFDDFIRPVSIIRFNRNCI